MNEPNKNIYITNKYPITIILLIINLAIFGIMGYKGVDLNNPSAKQLIFWGAVTKLLVLDGEWWRLLSYSFLHLGFMHIIFNSYMLVSIGKDLERVLGSMKFITVYLLSAIGASIASIYWHNNTASVGASGAIFGLSGAFLILLKTNLIDEKVRKVTFRSIVIFVIISLLYGLTDGIDNAAHVGGLVSGFLIGYLYYPSLIKPNHQWLKGFTIVFVSALFLASSYFVVINFKSDENIWFKQFGVIAQLDTEASDATDSLYVLENTNNKELLDNLQNVGIVNWNECIKILNELESLKLSNEAFDINKLLLTYSNLKIQSCELMIKAINEDTDAYISEIEIINTKIQGVVDKMNKITL